MMLYPLLNLVIQQTTLLANKILHLKSVLTASKTFTLEKPQII